MRRAASAVAPLVAARGLCAPAVPLIDEVRADLAMMKEKIGEAKGGGDYTVEAFTAALNAGTVDTGLLSSTMDFSDEARKVRLALAPPTLSPVAPGRLAAEGVERNLAGSPLRSPCAVREDGASPRSPRGPLRPVRFACPSCRGTHPRPWSAAQWSPRACPPLVPPFIYPLCS